MFGCCCTESTKDTELDLSKRIPQRSANSDDLEDQKDVPKKVDINSAGATFEADLDVEGSDDSGVSVDVTSGEFPIVRQLRGAAQTYNNICPSGSEIKRYDRILRVDGQEAKCSEVVKLLETQGSNKRNLQLSLKRPREKEVVLRKPGKLGMTINYKKETLGVWIADLSDGLVSAWNQANKDAIVSVHDRIIGVNGFRGEPGALIDKMREGGDTIVLTILCYA